MKGNRLKALLPALLGGLALFLASCQQTQTQPDRVLSVTVTPATATIEVGQQVALTAQVQVTGNASTAVTWSSSDTAVATVDANGVVRGVAPGQAVIRATSVADSTKFGQATITVTPAERPNISILQPANGQVVAGNFVAQVRVQGSAGNLTSLTYTFAGGDPVSILSSGLQPQQYDITRTFTVNVPAGLADGSYQLTVRAEDSRGRSAEASVTVQLRRGPDIQIQLEPEGANSNLVVLEQNVGGVRQQVTYTRGNIRVRVAVDGRGLNPTRIEIFRGTTVEDTSNRLYDGPPGPGATAVVNTAGLPQGNRFFFIARVYFDRNVPGTDPPRNNITVARAFVPDNVGPQLPDIVPISQLPPARTAVRGNWVRGTFTQLLENLGSLVDNPVGTPFPASGIRSVIYYADRTPFDGVFNRDIVLGEAQASPYSLTINTAERLPDGTYLVFAVAVDQLGNESPIGAVSAYILNVDNTPPALTVTATDRAPRDVGTNCAGGGFVDIFPARPGFVSGCAAVNLVGRDTGVGLVPSTTTFSVNFDGGVPTAPIGPFAGANPNDPYRQGPINVNYDAAQGSRTIQVSLADELGNLARAQATFTVDNNRPTQPVFTSPAPGVYDAWSVVSLGAQATDPSTGVEEIRFYVASNAAAAAGVRRPYWHNASAAGRGLLQVGSVTGSAGSVSFRVPDPTNENNADSQRPLDLIALAIDSAGNANGNSLNITVRHTASQRHGVDMTLADGVGNNGFGLELFFLQPPSGTRLDIHIIARRPTAGSPYIPEAAQVGVSLYEAEYRDIGASTFFNEGSAAQVSFYFLSAPEDAFQAVINAGGGPAALNLPGYVAGAAVYNLIADVQASPYRATFALPPTQAIVALVFNEFGHTIPLDRGARVGSGPIFQVRALECPAGPYSISTPTPLDGTYNVQIFNNGAPADRFEFLYQRTGMPAPAVLNRPNPPGPPVALGTQLIPASGIVQAGPDPATGGPNPGFHGGRANFFDPGLYAAAQFGAGTYTQFLRVFEDTNGNSLADGTEPQALLNLCPTFQVTN